MWSLCGLRLFYFDFFFFLLQLFLTEACAEFLKQFLSLFLIGVSISQLFILDLLTKAAVSHNLCMGLWWCFPCRVCGCVQVSSCMMDEAGWTIFLLCSYYRMVENERQPPASTGTTHSLCHLQLQSISKLNGY